MTYRIEMTEQAEKDLRDIFEYIAFSCCWLRKLPLNF